MRNRHNVKAILLIGIALALLVAYTVFLWRSVTKLPPWLDEVISMHKLA